MQVTTRNIELLTVSAYKLDAEDYFRKKHALQGVESLDIDLVAPEHTWTEPVRATRSMCRSSATLALKPIATPGAWVVKVGDEKAFQAVTLVLVSDIEAIVKSSLNQVLVFVQDMATGRGRAGARVVAADQTGIVLAGRPGPTASCWRAGPGRWRSVCISTIWCSTARMWPRRGSVFRTPSRRG